MKQCAITKAMKRADRLYVCPVEGCDKAMLRRHKHERPFVCPVEGCTSTFTRKNRLEEHTQYCHGDERPYPCAVCGRTFSRMDGMQFHFANNHVPTRETYDADALGGEL